MKNMFQLGDVARQLSVQPYRIVYLFSSGSLPEPPRFGGRRIFSTEDILRIATKLKIEANIGGNDE